MVSSIAKVNSPVPIYVSTKVAFYNLMLGNYVMYSLVIPVRDVMSDAQYIHQSGYV